VYDFKLRTVAACSYACPDDYLGYSLLPRLASEVPEGWLYPAVNRKATPELVPAAWMATPERSNDRVSVDLQHYYPTVSVYCGKIAGAYQFSWNFLVSVYIS
jgi:hypothetical protein